MEEGRTISIENLRCPVCLEIPPENVFQCHQGHMVCAHCERKLRECPVCKTPYGKDKIRNLPIEVVLNSMKFPCENKEDGCDLVLERKQLSQHQSICTFGEKSIQICKMIGYACPFRVSSGEAMELFEEHLQTNHKAQVHKGSELQLVQEYSQQASKYWKNLVNIIWNPVVIHSEGKMFLILSYMDGAKDSVSWVCLHLDEHENKVKYHLDLFISGRDQGQGHLQWSQSCVNHLEAEGMLCWKPFQVPLSLLKENYMEDGRLTVKLSIREEFLTKVSSTKKFVSLVTVAGRIELDNDVKIEEDPLDEFDDRNFENSVCDICSKDPIRDTHLFYCLQCPDFWLCENCFSIATHPCYVFAVIHNNAQLSILKKVVITKGNRGAIKSRIAVMKNLVELKITPILPSGNFEDSEVHTRVLQKIQPEFEIRCNGCRRESIVGSRFKCLQCEDYNLCEVCVDAGTHSEHIFAIITNFFQNEFIDEEASKRSPIIKLPRFLESLDLQLE